jgi:mannose-1-phosphate guanylyltransferase/mannose-6-phosphate isomerase
VKKQKLRPIVLAGGSGKRLWPLSTKERPKQFIPFFGKYSLFDLTLLRLNKASLFKKPIIVTSEDYLGYVEGSITRTGIEPEKIILEPFSKNTFPAISLAVMTALLKNKDENFIATPSDHYISRNKEFHDSCLIARNNLKNEGLTLFGVKPDNASSEFGYINTSGLSKNINEVIEFIEKPDKEKAKEIFNQKDTLWNAGIFIFKGSWFVEVCKDVNKQIFDEVESLRPKNYPSSLHFLPNKSKFKKISDLPFDKVFVEKNKTNYVTILDAGWSDLGSWIALSDLQRDLSNEMKIFPDSTYYREERPWGYFETLMETETSKVKLLCVLPNHRLSLQKHKYRSETWYVIRGEAKVTKGNERFSLLSGDSIIIKQNEEHRLENLSNETLEIIEIQTGTYFGEDDIIRIQDSYGRADLH